MIRFCDKNGVVRTISRIMRKETQYGSMKNILKMYIGGNLVFEMETFSFVEFIADDNPASDRPWITLYTPGRYRFTAVGRGGNSAFYDNTRSSYNDVSCAGGGSGAVAIVEADVTDTDSPYYMVQPCLNRRVNTAGQSSGRTAIVNSYQQPIVVAGGGFNATAGHGTATGGAGGTVIAGDASLSFAGLSGNEQVGRDSGLECYGIGGNTVGNQRFGCGYSDYLNYNDYWHHNVMYPLDRRRDNKTANGYIRIERIA